MREAHLHDENATQEDVAQLRRRVWVHRTGRSLAEGRVKLGVLAHFVITTCYPHTSWTPSSWQGWLTCHTIRHLCSAVSGCDSQAPALHHGAAESPGKE